MYLFINNLIDGEIYLALSDKQGKIKFKILHHTTDRRVNILIFLDKLLKDAKTPLEKIKGLVVVTGPGSFSGIRTALAIVNTLAMGLKIPAAGVYLAPNKSNEDLIKQGLKKLLLTKKNTLVMPHYGAEPNITKPKNKNLI
jgi:tRNA A37 threonylcarbamoyladenosine modification protein TsaB